MKAAEPAGLERLASLAETVLREAGHLSTTDARLFALPFDGARVEMLARDIDLAERVDAFVARFGRLQDTAADKLLPELLRQLAEPVRSAVENLDRAEKLGLIEAADRWLEARRLRNRMVHEYQSDPAQLALALNEGHALVACCWTAPRQWAGRPITWSTAETAQHRRLEPGSVARPPRDSLPCSRGRARSRGVQAVPPTVSRSIFSVGWPTPTGTLWPSLPQVPTPVSSAMSLPIMLTRLSDSGPLPISVAPFTGYWMRPFSTQ